MARTTNMDTLPFVDSRYELGMLASQRVRDLNGGAQPLVEKNNDKLTVVALREIATGELDIDNTRHEFVQSYKESPASIDSMDALEVAGEDPVLREIDAELDAVLDSDADVEVGASDDAEETSAAVAEIESELEATLSAE